MWVTPNENSGSPHAMGNRISLLLVYADSNYEICAFRYCRESYVGELARAARYTGCATAGRVFSYLAFGPLRTASLLLSVFALVYRYCRISGILK